MTTSKYDPNAFTEEDLDYASQIFAKYYNDSSTRSIAPKRATANNLPKTLAQLESEGSDRLNPDISIESRRISARELHKYTIGAICIFILFLITYPIAMNRVSNQGKFARYQFHVKSLTYEYKQIEP